MSGPRPPQPSAGVLLESIEEERRQIAIELHDTVGQILSFLHLDLERMIARLDQYQGPQGLRRLKEDLERIASLNTEAIDKLRSAILSLTPSTLDNQDFTFLLSTYVERYKKMTNLDVNMKLYLDGHRLPDAVKTSTYRILQEALTNIYKHAKANRVAVIFKQKPGSIFLTIWDDGKGCDPARLKEKRIYGLNGMQERARLLGGSFRFVSAPGKGMTIHVRLPLKEVDGEGIS
ncbi:MAG: sensor histidine kinase [Thermodesulfobacteriota bacterium]